MKSSLFLATGTKKGKTHLFPSITNESFLKGLWKYYVLLETQTQGKPLNNNQSIMFLIRNWYAFNTLTTKYENSADVDFVSDVTLHTYLWKVSACQIQFDLHIPPKIN